MAGRKKNPCEFCEDDKYGDYVQGRNGLCAWYEFYPFNGLLSFIVQANDEGGEMIEGSVDIDVYYCPVCGRKLTNG